MGGVDPSSSDMTLTNLLFSPFIQAVVEADQKWTCQLHSQMTSAKREPGKVFNLYLNTPEIFFFFFQCRCCYLLVFSGNQSHKEANWLENGAFIIFFTPLANLS